MSRCFKSTCLIMVLRLASQSTLWTLYLCSQPPAHCLGISHWLGRSCSTCSLPGYLSLADFSQDVLAPAAVISCLPLHAFVIIPLSVMSSWAKLSLLCFPLICLSPRLNFIFHIFTYCLRTHRSLETLNGAGKVTSTESKKMSLLFFLSF